MTNVVKIRVGDIYRVAHSPGMWWFVERVDEKVAHVRCLRAKLSSWKYGMQAELKELNQPVIIRNVPDFIAATAYVALKGDRP